MSLFNINKKPILKYIEHDIVSHCNLNCAGCTHFSPLAEPCFEDINNFKKDFEKLKEVFDVSIIRIMGGEPLLHPQVLEFLKITKNLFPKAEIQLVTNGLLLNNNSELLDYIKKHNIIINLSDYGIVKNLNFYFINLKSSRKDFMYNLSLDLEGKQNSSYSYKNCYSREYACNYYKDGKFYVCAPSANVNIFNKYFNTNLPEEEGLSIYKYTPREILNYLYNTPCELCKYCDVDNQRKSNHPFYQSKKDIKEWIK